MPRRKKALVRDPVMPILLTVDELAALKLALSIWLWSYEGSPDPLVAKMAARIRLVVQTLDYVGEKKPE
jgi:hypothetical protein